VIFAQNATVIPFALNVIFGRLHPVVFADGKEREHAYILVALEVMGKFVTLTVKSATGLPVA